MCLGRYLASFVNKLNTYKEMCVVGGTFNLCALIKCKVALPVKLMMSF